MPGLFGTDGIRGVANADLTAELAVGVGRAVALAAREGLLGEPSPRPVVVVGRDPRRSGDFLQAAVAAGLASGGAEAVVAGILPTPAVAHLVAELGAEAGVVVSASHNPPEYNGIKVFGPGGWKLGVGAEEAIEALVGRCPPGPEGRVRELEGALERYLRHLEACASRGLGGVSVVADCAWGAAAVAAPEALRRLGARVSPVHDVPDGERINVGCGATHPEVVAGLARRGGVVGLAFDGDGDRVMAADETGEVVDGDAIMAILARELRSRGELTQDAIVVTVMSNQALRAWCAAEGIAVVETPVGDRYVLEAMRARGLALGGEQSGHVVLAGRATTGDGILTAILLLEAVAGGGGRLADLVPFRPLPQVLVNVPRRGPGPLESAGAAIEEARRALGASGRVLVRPSGTEPVVRVMVEAPTEAEARRWAEHVAAALRGG